MTIPWMVKADFDAKLLITLRIFLDGSKLIIVCSLSMSRLPNYSFVNFTKRVKIKI